MSRRSRLVAFGSAGVLVVIGALCGALIGGTAGQITAMVLIGGGLVLATGFVFLEVGLSEDRERAREERRKIRREQTTRPTRTGRPTGGRDRSRLGRSRGHRRRLGPP